MNGLAELPQTLLNLAVAFVLAVPVGWERDRHSPGAGVRTYPLLALGACAFLEVGQSAFPDNLDAQARVFQGLVSGIGFIGAGVIIKGAAQVRGLATAVSLWITAAVGTAAAYELYALSGVLVVAELVVLRWLRKWLGRPPEAERDEQVAREALAGRPSPQTT